MDTDKAVIAAIQEALRAEIDPDAEGFAKIFRIGNPGDHCATLLVISGDHKDSLTDWVMGLEGAYISSRTVRNDKGIA